MTYLCPFGTENGKKWNLLLTRKTFFWQVHLLSTNESWKSAVINMRTCLLCRLAQKKILFWSRSLKEHLKIEINILFIKLCSKNKNYWNNSIFSKIFKFSLHNEEILQQPFEIFYIVQIQNRIVSAETIRRNTVSFLSFSK